MFTQKKTLSGHGEKLRCKSRREGDNFRRNNSARNLILISAFFEKKYIFFVKLLSLSYFYDNPKKIMLFKTW